MTQYNLQLTKSIQALTKQQTTFEKAVEKCNELIKEISEEFEMKLNAKKSELDALETQYQNTEKLKKVELDLAIKEYGYNKALEFLNDRGEIPVSKSEYEILKEENRILKASKEQEIKDAVSSEKQKNAAYNEQLKKTLELQKRAEIAQKEADLKVQINQIKLLENTIERLESDLEAQRNLTKDVANASAQSRQVFVPSSGK